MDVSALEKFGLNEKEIRVYLTLLKEGSANGSKVADKTNLHRRTAYDVLSSLSKKGLVTFVVKRRIKFFKVVDPKFLLDVVKEQEDAIKSIIPKLQLLKKSAEKETNVQIFQGLKSVKKIFDDILNYKEYVVLGAGAPLRELLGPYFLFFQKRKKEKSVKSRVLMALKYKKSDVATKTYGEVKFLKEYEAPTTTYIYANKIAIIISDPSLGIVIESQKIAKSFLSYFNLLWKLSK